VDFVQYISTPANTTEAEPLVTTLKLTRGRLTGGSVYFPSGPAGTLHVLLKIAGHQIVPFNRGQNLRLNDCVFPLSIGIDLLEPPYQVDIVTWNDSTLYAHALTVCLQLQPRARKNQTLRQILKDMAAEERPEETEEPAGGRYKP
jgi:hypothetical protein